MIGSRVVQPTYWRAPMGFRREATPNPGALKSSVFVPIRVALRQFPNSGSTPRPLMTDN